MSNSSAKRRAVPARNCSKAERIRASFSTRWGSSSLATNLARCHSQPSSCRQRRTVSADTTTPRRACTSRAPGAQLQRVRHQPQARGTAWRMPSRERFSAGASTVSRVGGRRPSAPSSHSSPPVRYARTTR
jgi:hypothetical protein